MLGSDVKSWPARALIACSEDADPSSHTSVAAWSGTYV
jgi:hypothetical protein